MYQVLSSPVFSFVSYMHIDMQVEPEQGEEEEFNTFADIISPFFKVSFDHVYTLEVEYTTNREGFP